MIHYIVDNNKEAKAYFGSKDGRLSVSVRFEKDHIQYDFDIDEKELQFIAYMIEKGKEADNG